MPIYLEALALKNYRGIGTEEQKMRHFKSFNFFIGANNSGKSTILSFLHNYFPPPGNHHYVDSQKRISKISSLEHHEQQSHVPIGVSFGLSIERALIHLERQNNVLNLRPALRGDIEKILIQIADTQKVIWKSNSLPFQKHFSFNDKSPDFIRDLFSIRRLQELWIALTNFSGGGNILDWTKDIVGTLDRQILPYLPDINLIPAIREIGPKGSEFKDLSGIGLIERLAELQNPEHDNRTDREKFDKINSLLQSVTGQADAMIEIPYSREHILVHMNSRVLPLKSLGTGIHELIMIASFCTLTTQQIICIEEPEIHLHPLLQRKLITYLSGNTENQYFIATHSATFIDTPGAAIFHVSQKDGTTRVGEALLKKERYAICVDLGHRASDILQANAVIWVEGPSDRIYIRKWLELAAPDLREAIDYSIMFYGGRLLSHLAADDSEVTEFIQLRDLNRNLAIVMDSDKSSYSSNINTTKTRIQNEFEDHGGFAWITKGREIENYVDHAILHMAIKEIYSESYVGPSGKSPFQHALHFRCNKLSSEGLAEYIKKDVDKVKVSKKVVSNAAISLDVLDLRERITDLVEMIRTANS